MVKAPKRTALEEKADQVVALAKLSVKRNPAPTWIEFANAYQGMGGWLQQFFPDLTELREFMQSAQHEEIMDLWETLKMPKSVPGPAEPTNGKILLRIPKSLHAALLVEADSEGVSLNQLCMAKLARQLRTVV